MLVLASASPRRRELLAQAGWHFTVQASAAEEVMDESLAPEELVVQNARQKALAVAAKREGLPVLGADTVVSLDGHIYGKPRDAADARRMLALLSGREHHVSTGIALVWRGEVYAEAVTTAVRFGTLSPEDIAAYVATGEPLDKAGAYAVQGRAAAFIEGIEGSFSNVVGLPLYAVRRLAGKAGVDLYGDYGEGFAGR